jgi:hypothetical protein
MELEQAEDCLNEAHLKLRNRSPKSSLMKKAAYLVEITATVT